VATGRVWDSFVLLPRILGCWGSFTRAFLPGRLNLFLRGSCSPTANFSKPSIFYKYNIVSGDAIPSNGLPPRPPPGQFRPRPPDRTTTLLATNQPANTPDRVPPFSFERVSSERDVLLCYRTPEEHQKTRRTPEEHQNPEEHQKERQKNPEEPRTQKEKNTSPPCKSIDKVFWTWSLDSGFSSLSSTRWSLLGSLCQQAAVRLAALCRCGRPLRRSAPLVLFGGCEGRPSCLSPRTSCLGAPSAPP